MAVVDDELDLRGYLRVLRRRWRWVAASLVVIIGAALGLAMSQPKTYKGSAELLIRSQSNEAIATDVQRPSAGDAERRLNNEIQILESGVVRDAARDAYDGPLNVRSVSASVASESSDAIRVSATGGNAVEVAELVNTYVVTFVETRRSQQVDETLAAGVEIQNQIDRLQADIDTLRTPLVVLDEQIAADPDDDSLVAQRDRLLPEIEADTAPLESRQDFYRQQLDDLELTGRLAQSGVVQLLTEATPASRPISPDPIRNGALGAVLGLIVGIGLAFLRDYFDESIRSVDDLDRAGGGLATLGLIPTVADEHQAKVVTDAEPTGAAAEAYRSLRTAVRFVGLERRMRIIQVTSASQGEGKTITVANLAATLAQASQRVAVVDCDLRRPRVHEVFGESLGPGLTDVLLGEVALSKALRKLSSNLYLLPAGSRPPNPSELLGTARAETVLGTLADEFDYVVLDSTPILPVTDGIVVSRLAHAVLFVVEARHTSRNHVRHATASLQQADAPLLGFVLNRVPQGGHGYYGGYGYANAYRYDVDTARGDGRTNGHGFLRRRRSEEEPEPLRLDA